MVSCSNCFKMIRGTSSTSDYDRGRDHGWRFEGDFAYCKECCDKIDEACAFAVAEKRKLEQLKNVVKLEVFS